MSGQSYAGVLCWSTLRRGLCSDLSLPGWQISGSAAAVSTVTVWPLPDRSVRGRRFRARQLNPGGIYNAFKDIPDLYMDEEGRYQ